MAREKLDLSREEQFYLINMIIITAFSALCIAIFSNIVFPYPGFFISNLLDFFRRFIILMILIGLFFYIIIYLLKFGINKISKSMIVFLIGALFFMVPFSFTIVRDKIEEGCYLPFNDCVYGGVYLWNNQSNNGICTQNIHIVFFIIGERWFYPYPTDFILEFNNSKYLNCSLSKVNFKGGTNPADIYYNKSSSVNVSWDEDDFTKQKGYYANWWIDFVLTWESNNSTIAFPNNYKIIIDGPDGLTDVCWGVLCYNPNVPKFHSKYWAEQIYFHKKSGKYSCNC